MEIQTTDNGMAVWFWKTWSKSISVDWYWKYWEKWVWWYHDNWAKKWTSDSCFDCTINIWYISFGYTNWNFNKIK